MLLSRNLCLLAIAFCLAGCGYNPPQTRPMASESEYQHAKKFTRYPDYANVYFVYPDFAVNYSSLNIFANDTQLGQVGMGQYINVKAAPGLHHFIVDNTNSNWPGNNYYNGRFAQFDLDLKAGSIAFVYCTEGHLNELSREVRGQYLLPFQKCTEDTGRHKTNRNGVSSCSAPVNRKNSTKYCYLTSDDRQIVSWSEQMVKADVALVVNREVAEFKKVKRINTVSAYNAHLKKYPNSSYKSEIQADLVALQQRQTEREAELAIKAIAAKEKCKIRDKDWLYIDKSCRSGFANGNGRAININQQNSFKGKISNGKLVSGVYMLAGEAVYEGKFIGGKPDGYGICMYKGEPEECRYHKGYRIDSLFKQRKEIAAMDQRRQQDMSELRKEIGSIKSQRSSVGSSASGSIMDSAGKVILDKAAERAVDELFNHLF